MYKFSSYILLSALIFYLLACNRIQKNSTFFETKIALQEFEKYAIESIPYKIGFVNRDVIAFINGSESIIFYKTDGEFIKEIKIDLDFKKLVKELINNDTSQTFFDLEESDNASIKTYPWYTINNICFNNASIYVSTYVTKPTISNGTIIISKIEIIFKLNSEGHIVDYHEINMQPQEEIWLIARSGFYVDNHETVYSFGQYDNDQIYNTIPVAQNILTNDSLITNRFYNIPWPEDVFFKDESQKRKWTVDKSKKRFSLTCQFDYLNDSVYFSNTKRIFNLKKKEVFYDLGDSFSDNTLKTIKSFCFVSEDKTRTGQKLVYIEESKLKFSCGSIDYNLVVINLKNKAVIYKKQLSQKPSGLCSHQNKVYLLLESDEQYWLQTLTIQ